MLSNMGRGDRDEDRRMPRLHVPSPTFRIPVTTPHVPKLFIYLYFNLNSSRTIVFYTSHLVKKSISKWGLEGGLIVNVSRYIQNLNMLWEIDCRFGFPSFSYFALSWFVV